MCFDTPRKIKNSKSLCLLWIEIVFTILRPSRYLYRLSSSRYQDLIEVWIPNRQKACHSEILFWILVLSTTLQLSLFSLEDGPRVYKDGFVFFMIPKGSYMCRRYILAWWIRGLFKGGCAFIRSSSAVFQNWSLTIAHFGHMSLCVPWAKLLNQGM